MSANFNRLHYDTQYKQVKLSDLLATMRNFDRFFSDAIKTDTSWVGFYYNDFHQQLKGKHLLEIGSGDGVNALCMAKLGARVTAVDISSEAADLLNAGAAQLGMSNVKGLSGDFEAMDFPDQFDLVVGKAIIHHLTHDMENAFLRKAAKLLKPEGEARFFEPATNSEFLDRIRFMIPVPGRPSSLQKQTFAEYKANDPHPERDNSSRHYIEYAKRYFEEVKCYPVGTLERLHRLLPRGPFNRSFRRAAYRLERLLPASVNLKLARSQVIVMRRPIFPAAQPNKGFE